MITVKDMLGALSNAGVRDGDIVAATKVSQPTINCLRRGTRADTSYTYGKRIEALYRQYFPADPNPS